MNTKVCTIVIAILISSVSHAQWSQPVPRTFTRFKNPFITDSPHTVLIINGNAYIQGDIYLGPVAELEAYETSVQPLSVTNDSGRWEGGIIPFVIADGFTNDDEKVIIAAMNYYMANTHVCFVPKTNHANYITYRKRTEEQLGYPGGQSAIGRQTGSQDLQLSVVNKRTVRHEIGHALGLLHEHAREDRDSFVEVIVDNIKFPWGGNFDKAVFTSTDVGEYDIESLMHYGPYSFGKEIITNGVVTTLQTIELRSDRGNVDFGLKKGLSARDVAAINVMYPTEKTCDLLIKDLLAGTYVIRATKSNGDSANRLLDLDASTNGDVLRINSISGGTSGTGQRWIVAKIPDASLGGYTIRNQKWLTYIDADMLNTGNSGCKVQGWERGNVVFGRTNQEWFVKVLSNPASGQFRCRVFNVKSPDMVLDASDVGSDNSAIVLKPNSTSDQSQEFIFKDVLANSTLNVTPTAPDFTPSSTLEYPTPLYIRVSPGTGWNQQNVQDIKTWITLDGSSPVENAANATLANTGFSGAAGPAIRVEGSGEKTVKARTFCTSQGVRVGGDIGIRHFHLYEPLPGPTGFTASQDNPKQISLSWNSITNATYDLFVLYSNDDPFGLGDHGFQIKVNPQPIHGATYVDDRYPGSGGSSNYYVRASLANSNRVTEATGPVVGTYGLPALTVVASQQNRQRTVRLVWSYPLWHVIGDYEMTFLIYRSSINDHDKASLLFTNQPTTRVVVVGEHVAHLPVGAETSYFDNTVQVGQTYYYWVIASTEYNNVHKSSPYGPAVKINVE